MSAKHPVIAITGSSGAGTTTVKRAFEHIFIREKINPVIIEGDSFHRYNRAEMKDAVAKDATGHFSHFGAEANIFDKLEALFKQYGQNGTGDKRFYLHSEQEAEPYDGLSRRIYTMGAHPRRHRPVVLRRTAWRCRNRHRKCGPIR